MLSGAASRSRRRWNRPASRRARWRWCWQFARLLEPQATYAWRFWQMSWTVTTPGSYTLMARATDTSGMAQPFAYDLDLNGFEVSQVQPVTVQVG